MSSTAFYLFVSGSSSTAETPEGVFYMTEGQSIAKSLCDLFTKEYGGAYPRTFTYKVTSAIPSAERVLLDETIEWLGVYSDPDPGVYDPAPPKELSERAQYAVRAQHWEELLKATCSQGNPAANRKSAPEGGPLPEQWGEMPAEERRNSGLIVLWLLAQAYYKVLECTFSSGRLLVTLDLNLNHSYMWTVESISKLLKNHPDLKDFPVAFEPLFPDLYPSTIIDVEWEDMVQPDADRFLSTVQKYVSSKGFYEPTEGSPAWVFVALFRPSIEEAIKSAAKYQQQIQAHEKRVFAKVTRPTPAEAQESNKTERSIAKRFSVALSFSGERRYFVEEVAKHLAVKIDRARLLYDKFHESEFARVNLDAYLQNLYRNEAELIAVFICSGYERKQWCGLEWRALRDIIKQRGDSAIMLFRFDETEIPGLFSIDGYIQVESRTPEDIANRILERLRISGV